MVWHVLVLCKCLVYERAGNISALFIFFFFWKAVKTCLGNFFQYKISLRFQTYTYSRLLVFVKKTFAVSFYLMELS